MFSFYSGWGQLSLSPAVSLWRDFKIRPICVWICSPGPYLWPESWPSACSAPVWPPCSSAAAWTGSTARNGSSVQRPETYPPNSYPGRRPTSARLSPGPAGAPRRERTGRTEMKRSRCQRVRSSCWSSWWLGLMGCRGIWPGCSVNSPPAAARTPPGSQRSSASGRHVNSAATISGALELGYFKIKYEFKSCVRLYCKHSKRL